MPINYHDGSNSSTGRIIQVVTGTRSSVFSTTSSSFTDIGLSASITPKESASKILIFLTIYSSSNDNHSQRLLRGSTVIEAGDSRGSSSRGFGGGFYCGSDADIGTMSGIFIDSPNTTSSTTYKVQTLVGGGGTVYYGRDDSGHTNFQHTSSRQRITLMEVAV